MKKDYTKYYYEYITMIVAFYQYPFYMWYKINKNK